MPNRASDEELHSISLNLSSSLQASKTSPTQPRDIPSVLPLRPTSLPPLSPFQQALPKPIGSLPRLDEAKEKEKVEVVEKDTTRGSHVGPSLFSGHSTSPPEEKRFSEGSEYPCDTGGPVHSHPHSHTSPCDPVYGEGELDLRHHVWDNQNNFHILYSRRLSASSQGTTNEDICLPHLHLYPDSEPELAPETETETACYLTTTTNLCYYSPTSDNYSDTLDSSSSSPHENRGTTLHDAYQSESSEEIGHQSFPINDVSSNYDRSFGERDEECTYKAPSTKRVHASSHEADRKQAGDMELALKPPRLPPPFSFLSDSDGKEERIRGCQEKELVCPTI